MTGTSLKTLRIKRKLPPADYSLKIKSYSDLCSATEKYETGVFEAGGYKWRMVLHPNGDKENNEEDHISLYLEIVEYDKLALNWEVNAVLTLLVYDQNDDKFLAVQDGTSGGVKRFHAMKTKWGFAQLLEIEKFKDPLKGYLVDDSCEFGAEVLVIKRTGNRETFSILKSPSINNTNLTFTKLIDKFSELKDRHLTEEFTVGGKKWKIEIRPNGDRDAKGKSLGLYLVPSNWESTTAPIYSEFKLRLLDHVNNQHYERKFTKWFVPPLFVGFGDKNFISLEELHKRSRGLIVKDSLVVEVELILLSVTKFGSDLS